MEEKFLIFYGQWENAQIENAKMGCLEKIEFKELDIPLVKFRAKQAKGNFLDAFKIC